MHHGQVVSGEDLVRKIEANPTGPNDKPQAEVKIADCGEMTDV